MYRQRVDGGSRRPRWNGRPIGTFTPVGGAPVNVFLPQNNDEQDFFVARAKLNFKFGTY